jgi:hypothetical protein
MKVFVLNPELEPRNQHHAKPQPSPPKIDSTADSHYTDTG